MNDEQHAYWESYIRHCADLFGLRDWRIELSREYTKNDDACATCRVWENQKGATIFLSDWFMKNYNAREQRETVLHELFHCHDYRMRTLVNGYNESQEQDGKAKWFTDLFRDEMERMCDAVTVPMALLFPFPENRPDPLPVEND